MDASERFKKYEIGVMWGILTINQCRYMEGLPPIPQGNDYVYPPQEIVGLPVLKDMATIESDEPTIIERTPGGGDA